MKPEEVAQVLRSPLLSSQKVILLALMVANRPLSLHELMDELNEPWPQMRRVIQRQIEYPLKSGIVSVDKSEMAHRYSVARLP